MARDLEGKVAIVTGAGDGLGRLHALQLASMGASVVVNDVGASLAGEGQDKSKAEKVVDEIEAAGGRAVVHFGDVANWKSGQELIECAVDNFGGLDALLLNAGILRDATIFTLEEKDFDDVVRVHLKGHFVPMKFACNYWRAKSKEVGGAVNGRIVSTSSEAALIGAPGQPNYAAAKSGIIAITMGVAQLMQKYGVTANVVLPRARTRMTMTGPTAMFFQKPAEGFDTFAAENVLPLFAYLCTPQSERISGYVFIVYGKQVKLIHRPTVQETFECASDAGWSVEELHAKLAPAFEKLKPVKDGFIFPPV